MRLTLENDDKPERQPVPTDVVIEAKIARVESVEKPWGAEMLTFEFDILEDPFTGRKVWDDLFPDFYVGERCRLYQWTLAILDEDELPEGFVLDTDAFVGVKIPIKLEKRTYWSKKHKEERTAIDVHLLRSSEAASLRATQPSLADAAQSGEAPSSGEPTIQGIQDDEEPF